VNELEHTQVFFLFGDFRMEKGDLEQKKSFLKTVAPFSIISTMGLERVADSFHVRKFKNRGTVIHQGDTTSDFYVIKKGKVRILTINEAGDESCLRVLGSGDVFGELSAYDSAPRSASVQALGACTILTMNHSDFIVHLREIPDLALAFIQFLSDKLRWTTLFSHTMAQYDTAGRLLHLILHYKERFGREIVAGKTYEVDLPLNQTDLASMVGARREWVNRLLQKWRKRGYITYNGGIITILDVVALVAEKNRRMAIFQDEI
jgi:CRP/FNR family transcriptional regulator, cyclic AMP receptor protein